MTLRTPAHDAGFSLIELAVYVVVLGLISTVVAATMLSLFRSEATVSGLTTSASDAQNATTLLRSDIRNAREFRDTPGGTALVASVASRSPEVAWECVRWSITDAGDGSVLTRETRPDATGNTYGPPLTLVEGITPSTPTTPYFDGSAPLGSPAPVEYAFRVATTAEGGTIDIVGEAQNRTQGDAALTPPPTCF